MILRLMASSLVLVVALQSAATVSAESWWGRDKALHLSAGLMIGSGCYGALALYDYDSAKTRTLICATLGQLPGLGKEVYDSGRAGNTFSGRDLVWTAIGVLVSSLALYLVEHLYSGDDQDQARDLSVSNN